MQDQTSGRSSGRPGAYHGDVPCQGCTACCHASGPRFLHPGDDPANYKTRMARDVYGQERLALQVQPNGDCIHLEAGGCGVWENRPFICRKFDCRMLYVSLTPDERDGIVNSENPAYAAIFAAARDRIVGEA